MYKKLFSPITINKLEIKNRIVSPCFGVSFSFDGKYSDRHYDFFREKAKGGAGIIIMGPVGIESLGSGFNTVSLRDDRNIPGFTKMADIIKKEGARAWVQLFHAGGYMLPRLIHGKNPKAPSAVFAKLSNTVPEALTIDEIKELQKAYVAAAVRVRTAGFDGIEIIASAGYLINQFLSPLKNLRTDEYGGSLENRLRFPLEVIAALRKELGPDFPLTIRMAGNDFVPGSNTDLETPVFAKAYAEAGIDAINVTGGWHETTVPQMAASLPRGGFAYLSLNIKKEVNVPVFASNRITNPDDAEKVIKDGFADMVCLGRPLIADPQWPNKAKAGKASEIRPCVACLEGCWANLLVGKSTACSSNPLAGYEGERKIVAAKKPKTVMVIGAGPAGLEAAVTASMAGHRVELYEKDERIGGQLNIAGVPPNKQELVEYLRYYRAMLEKQRIKLYLNTCVDIPLLKQKKPQHIIVAEGAEPLIPPIKGVDEPDVLNAWSVLKDGSALGKQVAVIGGGAVGLETAAFIAAKGTITPEVIHFLTTFEAESDERIKELMFRGVSRVTVFEMLPTVGADMVLTVKQGLLQELRRLGVDIQKGTKVLSISNGTVSFEKGDQTRSKKFDNIVIAAGSKSRNHLSEALGAIGIPHTVIGDGLKPGNIGSAIHGGFLAALEV